MLLALDTTGDTFSLALRQGERAVAEFCGGTPRQHLTEFFPLLTEVLASLGLAPRQLEAVAVTVGPGSFTGVRLGVLMARTLGQVLGCPLVAVNALEALALAAVEGDPLVVALDARKNEVFSAIFEVHRARARWRQPACLVGASEWVAQLPQGARVVGNALARYGVELAQQRPDVEQMPPDFSRVRGAAVAQLGVEGLSQGRALNWRELAPEYIRSADAQVQ